MERIIRNERMEAETITRKAAKEWTHWIKTCENFAQVLPTPINGEIDKLSILTNFVQQKIYETTSKWTTYNEVSSSAGPSGKCYLCGFKRHLCSECPAHGENCRNGGEKDHFWNTCRSFPCPNSQKRLQHQSCLINQSLRQLGHLRQDQ